MRCPTAAPLIVLDAMRDMVGTDDLDRAVGEAGEGTLVVVGIGQLDPPAQTKLLGHLKATKFRLIASDGLQLDGTSAAGRLHPDLSAILRSNEVFVPASPPRQRMRSGRMTGPTRAANCVQGCCGRSRWLRPRTSFRTTRSTT